MTRASSREAFAREAAVHVAEGELEDNIWRSLDITLDDLHQIFSLPEFEAALRDIAGESFLQNWKLAKEEELLTEGIRGKVRKSLDSYFDHLEAIALNEDISPETRSKILIRLIDSVKGLQPSTHNESVKMNRATVELFRETDEILNAQRDKYRVHIDEPEE